MSLLIKPASFLAGSIIPPPSKSYTIRAYLIASVSGKSLIINPSDCDDAIVALRVCKSLGAKINRRKNGYLIQGFTKKTKYPVSINVKESGTVLRFILSLLSFLTKNKIIIKGKGTLKSRPNSSLIEVLHKLGADIKGQGKEGTVPIIIRASTLKPGFLEVDAHLSSQFVSSLLLTCPLLSRMTTLKIKHGFLVSRPYIDMTIEVLKRAGIKIKRKGEGFFCIEGNQKFKGLGKFVVPPDYGLCAFFMVASCLIDSRIIFENLVEDNLVQADKQIIDILKKMGASINLFKNCIEMKGKVQLKGGDFSLRDSPDLVPVLTIAAMFAKGKTRLSGIAHVKFKESNRISDLRQELIKVGAKIDEAADSLIIHPTPKLKVNCILNSHNDHRLAMAFSILGLKIGTIVSHIDCVKKSYPHFLADLKRLKAQIVKS